MTFSIAKAAGAFSLAVLFSLSSQAATLDAIQGGVMVSRGGDPYRTASNPTQLSVGDSVIANPGGSARVVFENGCTDTIRPGMVYTVPETPVCQTGSNLGPGPLGSLKDSAVVTEPRDYTVLAVGAAVVAAGVGIAIIASNGDDDNGRFPASP